MFSFHRPKIYRSHYGCCICRAKSSSSRFTDSLKYESDFVRCFNISEHRAGEICNACVLLVKRWKKLPPGSTRNWEHVVDARAGPGTKSMSKIRNNNNSNNNGNNLPKPETFKKHVTKKRKHKHVRKSHSELSDEVQIELGIRATRQCQYRAPSPVYSDLSEDSNELPDSMQQFNQCSSFLDLSYWKRTKICCGIIFTGPHGEVMVDPSLLKPCNSCKKDGATGISDPQQSDGESNHSNDKSMPTTIEDEMIDDDLLDEDEDDDVYDDDMEQCIIDEAVIES
ncbi:SIN3-HDAC complex-associated factor-like [Tubulanus polymorphus]|uniref:SIN3-HDAC complex-associated factor-like n=1 Tax=Tubulanus polymorphus TaxID=672921 RepID=UPI003DA2340C